MNLERKRKFVAFLMAECMTFFLALPWVGVLTGEQWVNLQPWLLGLYGVAEAGEGGFNALANARKGGTNG